MENIAFSATQYQVALRKVNIALPLELIEELLDLVAELKNHGKVRQTQNGEYSILDFIGNVIEKGGNRKVWERVQKDHPEVVTICHYFQFPGLGQRKTPVCDLLGILTITYLMPGELGESLRKASAKLTITAIGAYKESLNALLSQPVDNSPAFPYSSKQIQEWVGYCNLSYLRDVIRLDYQQGVDYLEIDKEIYVNADIAQIILSCARPKHGVTIPEELQSCPFPWTKFQAHVFRKTNKRRSCSKSKPTTSPGQMELF
jgi:hypothetical protein